MAIGDHRRIQAERDSGHGSRIARALRMHPWARGRYMIITGQCNNCHTAGYSASQGTLPEAQWLLGDTRGRREPEGTVYATNLRHLVSQLTLQQWTLVARNSRARAPMPWWNLRQTSDEDLAAMYHYIRSLQPVGEPAPAFQPAKAP